MKKRGKNKKYKCQHFNNNHAIEKGGFLEIPFNNFTIEK
jgi:hypothetical protein